jgi:hypothetical protein
MLSGRTRVHAAAARLTCPFTIRQWQYKKEPMAGQGAKIQSGIETVILLAISDDKRREVPIIP